jgi:tripartite-type tricarboxylate transporter receptor subunit TctC
MFSRLIFAACALGMASAGALAQAKWPERPITVIVSQSGGASPDIMARLVADRLSKDIGPVVIENKPGGGNVVGALAAARSAPDGHTFFFATSAALVTNPFMMKNLPYSPEKDFAPVGLVVRSVQSIVAHPSVPAKNLAELIKLDEARNGKYNIAIDGPRNLAGVTAQALNRRANLNLTLVPYPNINIGVQDVLAGRTQLGIFSVSIIESHVRAGTLKPLAVPSQRPVPALPGVQAAGEVLPGFDFSGWFMLMAPRGTPEPIIKAMNAALDRAVRDPHVSSMAPKLGFQIDPAGVGSPQEAAAFLRDQLAMWAKITKELGIEPM